MRSIPESHTGKVVPYSVLIDECIRTLIPRIVPARDKLLHANIDPDELCIVLNAHDLTIPKRIQLILNMPVSYAPLPFDCAFMIGIRDRDGSN